MYILHTAYCHTSRLDEASKAPKKSESLTRPSIAPDPQGVAASDWQDLLAADDAMLWPGELMQKCLEWRLVVIKGSK